MKTILKYKHIIIYPTPKEDRGKLWIQSKLGKHYTSIVAGQSEYALPEGFNSYDIKQVWIES